MHIDELHTKPMAAVRLHAIVPAIPQRRPAYPRPHRRWPAFVARLACLLVLVAILAASGITYFATPSSLSIFDAKPTPATAPCARVTLIQSQGTLTTKIDEVCRP